MDRRIAKLDDGGDVSVEYGTEADEVSSRLAAHVGSRSSLNHLEVPTL